MKIYFYMAWRQFVASGIKAVLLSVFFGIVFLSIFFSDAVNKGILEQSIHEQIGSQVAGGHWRYGDYSPLDPLSFRDNRDTVPQVIEGLPILEQPATLYVHGDSRLISIRGIAPDQTLLDIDFSQLKSADPDIDDEFPVMLGQRAATAFGLQKGDIFTLQWRTATGAFDARLAYVAHIFSTPIGDMDVNKMWLDLTVMQRLYDLPDHASFVVAPEVLKDAPSVSQWRYLSRDDMMADLYDMIASRKQMSAVLLYMLFGIVLLALLDTQTISIYRRRPQIGLMMCLGLRAPQVAFIFMLESLLYGLCGLMIGAVVFTPFGLYFSAYGFPLGMDSGSFGMAIGDRLYFSFSFLMMLKRSLVIILLMALAVYLPVRSILKLSPVDALRAAK